MNPRIPAAVLGLALLVAACAACAASAGAGVGGGNASSPAGPGDASAPSVQPSPTSGATVQAMPVFGPARLEVDGTLFGLNLDWGRETAEQAAAQLGRTPSVWVQFAAFPFDAGARDYVAAFYDQVAGQGGMALLTLEPNSGLDAVTDAAVAELATLVADEAARGVPTFVRFAHEMNGSWYAWGQQPASYVAAFRRVADAVHAATPYAAMVWAPNYGAGYPFSGGAYEAAAGSSAFDAADTDADGVLTAADDPYAPYFPGDAAVDWVGMSLYHWGNVYPWGENEVPEAGAFVARLTGTYDGANGDETAVPDFYATYADGHDKPMAITETAALYDPAGSGPSEAAVKTAWWNEVFAPGVRDAFPRIRMINWFEWRKDEAEVGRVIDWRIGADPALGAELLAATPDGWLTFAAP